MPREAKELFLERHQEIERGFSQKFEALAGERKLAEGIRQAVPPNIRAQMESLKLDEIGAFTGLLQLQQKSKQDPYGYVRDFVVRNRMDLRRLIGSIAGNAEQEDGGMQADIESHPVVRHFMAEVETLKGTVSGDLRKREQQDSDRLEGEMSTALAEKGEDGNSRYPFIRVLADTMAQIVDRNPERFDAMGTQEVVAEAYKLALEAYPELKQTQRTARASRLDEDDADSAEDEASARLQQAATKKSKTPLSVPGTPGDPFSRAFSKAEKQLAR